MCIRDSQREDHDPAAIDRQIHEAEIDAALQQIGDRIGQPRRAEIILEQALDDQRHAECQQQAVEMIQPRQPLQHGALEDDTEQADHDRRQQQRPPVADASVFQEKVRHERAHHVERAMGEIDDVQHAENHGKAETQQRIERAVDQTNQELGIKGLHVDRSFVSGSRGTEG